ncbi:MAG: HEAT repeat domain-containing protein [Bacteroidales bacterium]|nr:HEAT repeat domain-containing protein [Bacteroidales bacterium]
MKRILLAIVSVCLAATVSAQNIKLEKPTSKKGNTFAIVIDNGTYEACKPQVYAYRDALQDDGLKTYILRGDWENPMQIREELKKLYKKAKNFEGIVLIGDIPVAMVRNAQHMTTAFKMDEDKFDRNESSVGSDRFYDDLHLDFEYLGQDTVDTDFFYYNLKTDCAQHLNPTYYSARIKYPAELGGDKYEAIAIFLEKVVAAKKTGEDLDNIVTFAGHGYNSDCLITWLDESVTLEENFQFVKNSSRNLKQLNFRHEDYMKYRLFDELQRPEVDAIFFNEHGSIDKQHISELPAQETPQDYVNKYRHGWGWDAGPYDILSKEVAKRKKAGMSDDDANAYAKRLIDTLCTDFHVTPKFFDDWWKTQNMTPEERKAANEKAKEDRRLIIIDLKDLKGFNPQPYFVMFNACYNGSFHRKGNISGYYIFGNGRTVVCQGNTVNVLQDKWTYECVGIISLGARIGEYNRLVATLEGHLIGDPTFHFNSGADFDFKGVIAANRTNAAYWRSQLDNPYPAVQNVAMRMLRDLNQISSEEILQKMKDSKFGTVRMECLTLLSRMDNDHFVEALKLGLKDRYEVVRRRAADLCGRNGDPRVMETMMDVFVNYPEAKRVNYNISTNFLNVNHQALKDALEKVKPSMTYLNNDEVVDEVSKSIARNQKRYESTVKEIFDKSAKEGERISDIRMTRNYNLHEAIPQFLEALTDKDNSLKVKLNIAEALGWYIYSYRKQEIIDGCQKILAEISDLEPELRAELTQTINRLK